MPKISVIIAVYNVEKYLRQCLDSVVNQTLKDIEIICIDDGSTDNSPKILERYANKDDRIKIITQQNQGQSVARNKGIEVAKGKYISFQDSDDVWLPQKLEKQITKAIETNADVIIAVMSGNFMQRGVPASFDKWARTKMALEGGADVVIELPIIC